MERDTLKADPNYHLIYEIVSLRKELNQLINQSKREAKINERIFYLLVVIAFIAGIVIAVWFIQSASPVCIVNSI